MNGASKHRQDYCTWCLTVLRRGALWSYDCLKSLRFVIGVFKTGESARLCVISNPLKKEMWGLADGGTSHPAGVLITCVYHLWESLVGIHTRAVATQKQHPTAWLGTEKTGISC